LSVCVLDCSVAAAWLFDDEADPETDALLARVAEEGAMVPNLWHLEVANVLRQAERRGRITAAQVNAGLEALSELPIHTNTETAARAFRDVVALARAHDLTTYDAAYLELALRSGVPLATRDRALLAAARTVDLPAALANP
jgi:predicted nucleic acid-binding protein